MYEQDGTCMELSLHTPLCNLKEKKYLCVAHVSSQTAWTKYWLKKKSACVSSFLVLPDTLM